MFVDMTPAEQVAAARAAIARRRAIAEATTPGPWNCSDHEVWQGDDVYALVVCTFVDNDETDEDLPHIAANDPTHVLVVLADADATLDKHAATWEEEEDGGECKVCWGEPWPCTDALAVLNRYVPQDPT